MSKIGYIRVSTEHQETAGNHVRLSGPPHLLREDFGEHAKCFAIC